MELPFSSFELTFIIIAFIIFSLFSLASVCIQPQEALPGTKPPVTRYKQIRFSFSNTTYCMWILFQKKMSMKQRSHYHWTGSREWSPSKLDRSHNGKLRFFICWDPTVLWSSHSRNDTKWTGTWRPCCPFCLFWIRPCHYAHKDSLQHWRCLSFILNSPFFHFALGSYPHISVSPT